MSGTGEMRLSSLLAPRFHLPQDILWYTFYFVVQRPVNHSSLRSPSKHSALNNLRHLSQVCALWRGLLLSSSSLWGMVIELDKLSQRTCHWRNEVLRRTGNSLLNIHCDFRTECTDVLAQFLALLLDEHWPRVRNLDIELLGLFTTEGDKFMQKAISAFQKPAINLESFSVKLGTTTCEISSINTRLFADQAPVLQEFTGYSFRIYPQRSWFSKLRVLCLTCLWTAHELLATLAGMPLLEILDFNEDDDDEDGSVLDPSVVGRDNLPRVVLPQLKKLGAVTGEALVKYIAVLERIVPAPGLRFSLISCVVSLAPADLIAVQRVLCSYLQLSFKNESPDDLYIVMTGYHVLVSLSKGSHRFSFEFEFDGDDGDVPDITTLLEPISLISLEYTTILTIDIDGVPFAATDTTLPRILLSSASIKELNITGYGLNLLLSLSMSTDNILFPILHLLRLNGPHEAGPILDFLSRRYAQEAPIQCLNFSEYQHEGSCDFRSLEQFNGLKVRWAGTGGKTKKYTCGSGNPQVLDFTQNLPEP